MKKVFITILAIVYLATSSVAAVTMHYCMGKMYEVNFSDNNKCNKCGMQHEKGCCETKVKVLQAQDAHSLVSPEISFQPSFAILETTYPVYNTTFSVAVSHLTTHNNSPPLSGTSLSILYCVFRL